MYYYVKTKYRTRGVFLVAKFFSLEEAERYISFLKRIVPMSEAFPLRLIESDVDRTDYFWYDDVPDSK